MSVDYAYSRLLDSAWTWPELDNIDPVAIPEGAEYIDVKHSDGELIMSEEHTRHAD